MINFHSPTPADRLWAAPLLRAHRSRACEFAFTNVFAWKDAYRQEVAQVEGCFVDRLRGVLGGAYLFPAGPGDPTAALRALEEDAALRGEPFRLVCLSRREMEALAALRPGEFTFHEDRDGFDYLYDIDRLADLPGKKLHNKRGHIRRFEDAYPDWTWEPITAENLPQCREMDALWYEEKRVADQDQPQAEESLDEEGAALRLAMDHYFDLGLEGILLRAEGRVVAFTMGELLTDDVYDVHFEKAFPQIQGAYPLVNRTFARWVRERHPQVRRLNREDDVGVPGLRKAKESYYPDEMVEKFSALHREDVL